MTVTAKPLLKDKFWILEDEGVRIGTLTKDDGGFLFSKKGEVSYFQDEKHLRKRFGKLSLSAVIVEPHRDEQDHNVHGYPTRCTPYNSMFDIKRNLPLFTKSEKSRSVYCAGYYLIKFNVNWLKSFCPKLITVERNEYLGPFKTDLEMKLFLANANRTT